MGMDARLKEWKKGREEYIKELETDLWRLRRRWMWASLWFFAAVVVFITGVVAFIMAAFL